MKEIIRQALSQMEIEADEVCLDRLNEYARLLAHWNTLMNLTAISGEEDIAQKHFADSLSIVRTGLLNGTEKMIDVGTGAGFPGLPLAIFYPESHITLLDSTNKRINFLKTTVEELGLENVRLVCMRAEDAAKKPEFREKFDVALSRAVAQLVTLTELSLGFVKRDGLMIAYKASSAAQEAEKAEKCIRTCGGKLRGIVSARMTDSEHNFVVIDKKQPTPAKYPRAFANIRKKPIL